MVEHIRHRPDSRFVLRKSSQKTRNHYGSEYDAQLTKEQDFMNIEERPTSSQYLLWINHMARQSLDFPRLEKVRTVAKSDDWKRLQVKFTLPDRSKSGDNEADFSVLFLSSVKFALPQGKRP
ncbi:hypothetical protein RvY_03054-2 [Ramazzottius varieornatus]|uniref:Uncharacterized protein n=1 Tax=Ramazzottius varieornatus TaxID=947166 RepID=A0A1D1ULR0_RAMVA|nr:hypothetical protein RvY_03054-2 [Ramazzottius varieornatus]